MIRKISSFVICGLATLLGRGASAESLKTIGMPKDWQTGFQPAVTDIMQQTTWFHNSLLLPIITTIAALVGLLMLFVLIRFRAKVNPVPRKFAHNSLIETIWTLIPAMIVTTLGILGVRQVYFQDAPPQDILAEYAGLPASESEVTFKAIGSRWFWTYEYPGEDIEFDSNLIEEADLKEGQPRLLATDTHVVLPVDTIIRLQVTADPNDVIHSWTIPAFGVKIDAIPGRLNERWFRVKEGFEGRYYGQCSELCGARHAYMPITVDIVSKQAYRAWLEEAKQQYGAGNTVPADNTVPRTVALSAGAVR